jgi:hypothetical protein
MSTGKMQHPRHARAKPHAESGAAPEQGTREAACFSASANACEGNAFLVLNRVLCQGNATIKSVWLENDSCAGVLGAQHVSAILCMSLDLSTRPSGIANERCTPLHMTVDTPLELFLALGRHCPLAACEGRHTVALTRTRAQQGPESLAQLP